MKFKKIYSKKYSKIDNMQEEKIVNYYLLYYEFKDEKFYGIRIISYQKDLVDEDAIEKISDDEEFVLELIKYLYENSIDTIFFRDVVKEMLVKKV